jgi:hypothetical protein
MTTIYDRAVSVDGIARNDHHRPRSRLLTAFGGVKACAEQRHRERVLAARE